MPSRSGSPRSSSDDVGARRRRPARAASSPVAASSTSNARALQARAERAAQRRVVLDHEHGRHRGSRRHHVTRTWRPPRRLLAPDRAAVRGRRARARSRGRARCRSRRVARRRARTPRRSASRSASGTPGTVVGDPHLARRSASAPRQHDTRISEPGGANRSAFSSRLPKTCSIICTSTSTSPNVGGTSSRTRWARASGRSRRTAACARSREVDGLPAHLQPAGADPAQLEDVGDQPFEPLGLVVDRVEQLGAVVGERSRSGARSVDDAALIDASGVRRLCVTADRNPDRVRPTCASTRASRASVSSRSRSMAAASPATSASSSARSALASGCSRLATDLHFQGCDAHRRGRARDAGARRRSS